MGSWSWVHCITSMCLGGPVALCRASELAFYLVEFCQMCSIDGFIAKHSVNGEVLDGLETFLSQFVQHARRNGRGVRPKDILLSFSQLPVISITGKKAQSFSQTLLV